MVLRTPAQHGRRYIRALRSALPRMGVYANVLRSGTVRSSDHLPMQLAIAAA